MERSMINKSLVEQTLGFHGFPLMKTWNEEFGANSLNNLGIQSNNIDSKLYHSRLKSLSYADCTKRLKLHRFICSKSASLFKNFHDDAVDKRIKKLLTSGGDLIPPLEYFTQINKDERVNKFILNLQVGDIVYGIVQQSTKFGITIKILCSLGSTTCLVSDLNLKGIVTQQNLIPAFDSKNVSRQFLTNDYVCCEFLEQGDQYSELNLGMKSYYERYDNGPKLGLITFHQLPHFYKVAIDQRNQDKSYNQILKESENYKNPSLIDNLLIETGLHPNSYYSLMSKNKFPQDEYAKDLRQQQASKLAFRSVAEGIAYFKEGRHTEAFQCLNKALSIDQRNVEGLVARGALFANSGSFSKAIVDFEAALKINQNHANAKKYLGETLLALGRNFEEDNKFEEAQKAYIDCLNINPHHQEALASLNYIKSKLNVKKIVEPAELELPPLNIGSIPPLKESKRDYHESIKNRDDSRKKSKKDKKKKGKKRHSSSSESSSESSDSSDSSSESTDNSSSSSDSDSNRSKKKDKKRNTLSPISKRIDAADSSYHYNQSFEMDDHELKVKKFLEMEKDEDDYEEKVGQLIAEASKYQKSKQAEEAKQTKKKKKSEKKLKKEKKKRKKDDKKKSKGNEIEDLREALKMFENLPEKIKKLYQEKMKEEEAAKLKNSDGGPAGEEEGKWKMKFSKDERGETKKSQTIKNFSLYESDDEDQARNFQGHAPAQTTTSTYGGPSTSNVDKKRSPTKQEIATVSIIPKGPVVLDKFGNFRLADPQPVLKPAETSTRRSRSRSRRSRSRSDSRSPRRRRSGSYRRRYSRSRSYSRSYSRSPSSRRGGRGFPRRTFNDRRQRYSPRGGRGGNAVRGRWNDNFRDSRDYRRPDRFDRDRPRGGRGGGRFGGGGGRFDRRSISRSPDRSPKNSPDNRRDADRKDRWADESIDEMDLINKSRKEKMDDMMDRNKDILKKSGSGGSSMW